MSTNVKQALFLPHANIQYSQLHPDRRPWVVRASYERLFDLLLTDPRYRLGFEASGETIQVMADSCPDVLEKLRHLLRTGQVEAVGSPHTHIMLGNVDREIGLQSLIKGREVWEQHTGFCPTVGWNPECSWTSYLPEIFKEAGFETLIMDGDSFLLSFEEVRKVTGLGFDVSGHSNKNQLFRIEEYIADKPQFLRYLTNPSRAANGLQLIFRSDMMANLMLWYLMGATEGVRDEPVTLGEIRNMLGKWIPRIEATGSFIMPYAEDAEYIGTTAYFYVKQFGQARFFEPEPASVTRFRQILDAALEHGYALSTPSDILRDRRDLIENPPIENIENGVAWHGGTAKAWANTGFSRILDPVCGMVHEGVRAVAGALGQTAPFGDPDLHAALVRLTSAYVSDSRWPPLPTTPGRFNVQESIADLYAANGYLAAAMERNGLTGRRALYSPDLMKTQIARIEGELMAMAYFGE